LRVPLYVMRSSGVERRWVGRSPAMAAGLSGHLWRIEEFLHYKVVPALAGKEGNRTATKTAVFSRAA